MFSDQPATKDKLGLQKYFDGIVDFIQACDTPMTIAIQGSWGTGKTSALKIIQGSLPADKASAIWFDTWQYAVLGAEEGLVSLLMGQFLDEINDRIEKQQSQDTKKLEVVADGLRKAFGWVRLFFRGATEAAAGHFGGDAAEKALHGGFDSAARASDGKMRIGAVSGLADVKKSIQSGIDALAGTDESASSKSPKRLVVFVDDLDRLEPRRALEFLEGVKNFIDCQHCVFVLAVDDKVVRAGIAAKYKFDVNDETAKDYTRHFFDKIIQVPFRMREDQYDLKAYIREEGFLHTGVNAGDGDASGGGSADSTAGSFDDALLSEYERAINAFDARNPRSIKRAFNLMSLYEKIDDGMPRNHRERLYLFMILLMQMNYPDSLGRLINAAQHSNTDVVAIIKDDGGEIDQGFACARFALGCDFIEDAWDYTNAEVSIERFAKAVQSFANVGTAIKSAQPCEDGGLFDPEHALTQFLDGMEGLVSKPREKDPRGWYLSQVEYRIDEQKKLLVTKTKVGDVNLTVYANMPTKLESSDNIISDGEKFTFRKVQTLDRGEFAWLVGCIEEALH